MSRIGFIHDKLDIKFLVLYIVARMEAPIDFATLTDLAMCDDGVDYFIFSQAVSELVQSEHMTLEDERYAITEKGRKNGAICEESLPFSVRQKCDQNLAKINARLRYEAQIRTEVEPRENQGYNVRFILDDHQDNLMTLSLFAPTLEQANQMAEQYKKSPDVLYRTILSSLTPSDE